MISVGVGTIIQDITRILNWKIETPPVKYPGNGCKSNKEISKHMDGIREKFSAKLSKKRRKFLSKAAKLN